MAEKNNTVQISRGEILYWLFFCSLLFAKGVGLYDGQFIFKIILLFAVVCIMIKICMESYTIIEYVEIFVIIGLTAVAYMISGEKGLLLYGLMVTGMKHVDLKRIFSIGTVLWTIAFFLTIISSLFHMDKTVYKVHAKLGLGHIFRWSLGYTHPNILQISYFILAVFILFALYNEFRIRHAVYLFIGNLFIFLYSVSYTGMIAFICLLVGRIYLYYRKRLGNLEKVLLQLIFPLCVLLSLIVPVVLDGKAFQILNKLLNTRLGLAKYYLKPEYITPFGIRVANITSETLTMDNSYLFAFITYGYIPFAIICLATVYVIYRYVKNEKYIEVLIFAAIAVGGLTEPFLYNTSFKNLTFLFMGALLFEPKAEKREWNIIFWKKRLQDNRMVEINTEKLVKMRGKIKQIISFNSKKCIAGIFGAVLFCIAANFLITYPEGYVVYRVHCADIGEEKKYYDEQNPEYANYKRMSDFAQGDIIEYFSGNIVLMERFRNSINSIVFGYAIGYILIAWGGNVILAPNDKKQDMVRKK